MIHLDAVVIKHVYSWIMFLRQRLGTEQATAAAVFVVC